MASTWVHLNNRFVLKVSGKDRASFLQGLTTNDVTKLSAENTLYSLFLNAQGRFVHDFFLAAHGDSFLLTLEKDRIEALVKKLSFFN